jgi:hypothetical protein
MQLGTKSQKQLLVTVALALVAAALIPRFLNSIELLGHNIPNFIYTDKATDYIKGWFAALFFMLVISMLPIGSEDKKNLKLFWLAKIVVCLVFMLFYESNYLLDCYWYFQRSQDRWPDMSDVGFGNGTANMAFLTWTFEHYVLPTASFHTQKVICAFFGTMGIFLLYRGLKKLRPEIPPRFLLAIGLFPSVLFWSSTLGKDALIVFGISVGFYGMLRMLQSRNPAYLVPAIFGIVVASFIRVWFLPLLIIPFVFVFLFHTRNILVRLALIAAMGGGLAYSVPKLAQKLSIENVDQLAQRAGAVSRSWQRGGSAGDVPIITTPGEALRFLPVGFFTALFRPLPGEVMNPFGLLAGLENLLFLALLWRAVRNWHRSYWRDELVVWFFAYVVLWGLLYAFISPQNLGAAVRFKVQVLPEMLFLLAYTAFIKKPSGGPAAG